MLPTPSTAPTSGLGSSGETGSFPASYTTNSGCIATAPRSKTALKLMLKGYAAGKSHPPSANTDRSDPKSYVVKMWTHPRSSQTPEEHTDAGFPKR